MDNNWIIGRIYKIYSTKDPDMIYIGNTISNRWKGLLVEIGRKYKKLNTEQKYCEDNNYPYPIFNKYGLETCRLELVEIFLCKTIQQLKLEACSVIVELNAI